MLLEEMTTNEVRDYLSKNNVIIIPVGATEQHGPANPLGTDFFVAQYIAREASKRANIICAPTIPIGISEHHKQFAGSLWLRPEVYMALIRQYIQCFIYHGFKKIIILNGHGGNNIYLNQVAQELFFDQNIRIVAPFVADFFDIKMVSELFPGFVYKHAEEIETSVNLAIYPSLVKVDKLSNIPEPPLIWGLHINNIQIPAHLSEFAPNGIVGSIKNINKESGKKILEVAINNLIKFIEDFRNF